MNSRINFPLALIFFLLIPFAHASGMEAPDEINLNDPGGSMEHVAVREQGHFEICYAEVAAQMADAWRFSHGDKEYAFQTSAMTLALQAGDPALTSHPDDGLSTRGGGFIDHAMEALVNQGACPQSDAVDSIDPQLTLQIVRLLASEARGDDVNFQAIHSQLNHVGLGSLLPPDGFIHSILEDKTLDLPTQLDRILSSNCARSGHSRKLELPKFSHIGYVAPGVVGVNGRNHRPDNPTAIFQEMHDYIGYLQLRIKDKTSLPVGISHCSAFLMLGQEAAGFDNKAMYQGGHCGKHATLVVGKRTNTTSGKLQFLLRNSWGANCGRNRNHTNHILSQRWECVDGGNLWVDADALERNLLELVDFVYRFRGPQGSR